ncbi:hypothetical protein Ciccas_006430, partial [Cichlidogyrus casuarinus]
MIAYHKVAKRDNVTLISETFVLLSEKQDAANTEIASLRRELAELRVSQAIKESLPGQGNSARALQAPQDPVDAARSTFSQEFYNSGLKDAVSALNLSEKSYFAITKSVSAALEMPSIPGQRSMAHLPEGERLALEKERQQAGGLLTQRICSLRDQLRRKDDLMQNYEREQHQMKQSDTLAALKTEQLEEMIVELRQKELEIDFLRQNVQDLEEKCHSNKSFPHKVNFTDIRIICLTFSMIFVVKCINTVRCIPKRKN